MSESTVDQLARSDLRAHMDICTERYGNLWDAVKGLREDINAARIARAESESAFHARLNSINNRMFAAVCSICGAAVLGLAVMVLRGLK